MKKLRNLKKGWALMLALVLTVTFAGPSYATGNSNGGGNDEPIYGGQKVTICHANNGVKGFTENNVSVKSIVKESGHDSHDDDIIPGFDYTVNGDNAHYAGKNLGANGETTGQAILDNGCEIPEQPKDKVVPELPIVVDECGTENDSYTLPSSTDSIKYSYSEGYVYAEIIAKNKEWDDAHDGWKHAGKGKLKFKIKYTNVPCGPGTQPDDKMVTTVVLGDYQCDSLSVEEVTTTEYIPAVLNHAGDGWVDGTDADSAKTVVTKDTRKLTDKEAEECAPAEPEKVTEWVLWTLPAAGCTDASKLNMGFENAGNTKGWGKCNTAENTFPQTDPQVMTKAELKAFVPKCGTWYQADKYTGTQAEIDAVLEDGQLTYTGGKVEDRNIVQKWFYLNGEDCVQEEPEVTEWVLWTLPAAGCTDASELNMGFENAGNTTGWDKCNTAENVFPQTDPKVMTKAELKAFVPACGTWYQADKYTGTQAEIDAVLEDGQLTYTGGTEEDRNIVQKWFYLNGEDCVQEEPEVTPVTPVAPTVVDMCGTEGDTVTPAVDTDSIHYTMKTSPNGDIKVTAQAQDGYVLTNGSAKDSTKKYYTITVGAGSQYQLDTRDCITVSVPDPSTECGFILGDYALPANTEGVTYEAWIAPSGQLRIKVTVDPTMHILLNHSAKDSYVKWFSFDVNQEVCPVAVTPVAPTVVDVCGTEGDSRTLPTTEGVAYAFGSHDDDDFLFAGLTAENTIWKLMHGWIDLGDKQAELKLADFSNEPCAVTEVLGTPPLEETPTDFTVVLGAPPLAAEAPPATAVVAEVTFAG